jgi:BirA family biotin operon repressor/biotin-[acetyl-CoA-carboxylase] ligase
MFSLAWRFKGPLHRMSGLPMAVGVALAETIAAGRTGADQVAQRPAARRRQAGRHPGGNQKTDDAIWAVIGCGINLLMPDELEAQIGREVAARRGWRRWTATS